MSWFVRNSVGRRRRRRFPWSQILTLFSQNQTQEWLDGQNTMTEETGTRRLVQTDHVNRPEPMTTQQHLLLNPWRLRTITDKLVGEHPHPCHNKSPLVAADRNVTVKWWSCKKVVVWYIKLHKCQIIGLWGEKNKTNTVYGPFKGLKHPLPSTSSQNWVTGSPAYCSRTTEWPLMQLTCGNCLAREKGSWGRRSEYNEMIAEAKNIMQKQWAEVQHRAQTLHMSNCIQAYDPVLNHWLIILIYWISMWKKSCTNKNGAGHTFKYFTHKITFETKRLCQSWATPHF